METSEDLVTATFEGGTKETGNLLVGCEGAHSPTRCFLLDPEEAELLPSPYVGSATITTLSREAAIKLRALNPRFTIILHPNGTWAWVSSQPPPSFKQLYSFYLRIITVHDCAAQDPAEWTWMLMQTWQSDEPTGLKDDNFLDAMYERGKEFGYPFNEAFAAIPKGTKVWHNRLRYWPTKPWNSRGGLVTLAGDAAHPMTFRKISPQ